MCLKSKIEVERLISGARGAICLECIYGSLAILDDQHLSKNGVSLYSIRAVTWSLIENYDAVSENYKNSVIELLKSAYRTSAESYGGLIEEFVEHNNAELYISALEFIDMKEWSSNQAINWMWANSKLGHYEKALSYPIEYFDTEDNDTKNHFIISRSSVLADTDLSEDEIESLITELVKIKDYYSIEEYPLKGSAWFYVGMANCALAEHYLKLGKLDLAERHINEYLINNKSAQALYIKGRIEELRGDCSAANETWEKAYKMCDYGIIKDKLAERLDRNFS